MQKITKIKSTIGAVTPKALVALFAVALMFGLVGTSTVDAATQSTYFVDVTGNGCGNNCADFYKYLASNGISVTSTTNSNTSNSTNNGSTTGYTSTNGVPVGQNGKAPSTSYVQYPYQVYTPFTGAGATNGTTNGSTTGNNGTTMGTINYVQYPYYAYQYFQDPTPKYDSYLSGQYPESAYIYYGKDATEQMSKYKKTYTASSSATPYSTSGSGFTITSILK